MQRTAHGAVAGMCGALILERPSLRRELVRSAAMGAGEKDLIVSEGDCCPHYSSKLLLSFSLM